MRKLSLICGLALSILLSACGGKGTQNEATLAGDTLTERAELLTLIDCGEYTAALVADPWNPGKKLAAYALVPRNGQLSQELPNGFVRVDVPLERSLVDSSTNTAAIFGLGAGKRIAAVADGQYYPPTDTVTALIASGQLADIGNSMSPALEVIVDVEPDAILSSPYKNAGHGVLETLGTPIIECADYMEATPLARAEWLLLLGELYGEREQARTIYDKVVKDYETLAALAAGAESANPKVLPELLTSGIWYVPGGRSYMARMLADAGTDYPWADDDSSGSLQLDAAAVIDRANDADVWYMRLSGTPTLASLRESSPLYAGIKAFGSGEVYNCNPSSTTFFSDIAFHPEMILADFISMFHPETLPDHQLKYFKKLAPQ